jgi:hypothetical protein
MVVVLMATYAAGTAESMKPAAGTRRRRPGFD